MRLRTKVVGATTVALVGVTLAVQRWAEAPLPPRHSQEAAAQGRAAPQAPVPPPPPARLAPTAYPATPPLTESASPVSRLPPSVEEAPSAAPPQARAQVSPSPEPGAREVTVVHDASTATPHPEGLAPREDEAARREVRALVLAAARELAELPPGTGAGEPPASELPRDPAELQPVTLEVGLPRVELSEPTAQAVPAARIDLATGAGLEATQPLPPDAAAPPGQEPPLAAQDATEVEAPLTEDEAPVEPEPEPGQLEEGAPQPPPIRY